MLVTAIQKYSIHDGDGTRTTLFFKGCPLRCAWCHNPETQLFPPELLADREKCLGCGACAEACPRGAVAVREGAAHTDRAKCVACGACVEVCPANIRQIAGEEKTPEELLRECLKDRRFYENTGGGVTFSGGEALAGDIDGLERLARLLRREEIPLAVDTCGHVPWERFERMLPFRPLFLYDLKLASPEKHRRWTGVDGSLIRGNLCRLAEAGAVIDLRVPTIGGVNADDEEISAMARFLREAGVRPRRVHLLPYHGAGASKYARLGRPYGGAAFFRPDEATLERLAEIFRQSGFPDTRIGG